MNEQTEEQFLIAMSAFLESLGFQVPGHWHDLNVRGQVAIAKIAAKTAKMISEAILNTKLHGMHVAAGAKEKVIASAMAPFIPLTNLVALRFPGPIKSQCVVAVILADRLSANDVVKRFPILITHGPSVASLGWHVQYQSLGLMIHPLVVYFDHDICARHQDQVIGNGWQTRFWRKIYLKAAVLDVQERRIRWAQPTGLARIGYSLGVRNELFGDKGLSDVLAHANL
jgi:hypothetical protein